MKIDKSMLGFYANHPWLVEFRRKGRKKYHYIGFYQRDDAKRWKNNFNHLDKQDMKVVDNRE